MDDVRIHRENRDLRDSSKYRYTNEKLSAAINKLTVGEGDIKERMLSIRLVFFQFGESSFPDFLRADWGQLKRTITGGVPLKHNDQVMFDSIESYMVKKRKKTVAKLAEKLVFIQHQLSGYLQNSNS